MTDSLFSGYTVLVADPDPGARGLICVGLKAIGFNTVIEAKTSVDALKQFNRYHVDLLLLDFFPNEDDSLGVLNFIRRSPRSPYRQLPAVLCTGRTWPDEVSLARDAGVSEIMSKPITMTSLVKKVGSALFNAREFVVAEGYVGPCRRRLKKIYSGPLRRKEELEAEASEFLSDAQSHAPL